MLSFLSYNPSLFRVLERTLNPQVGISPFEEKYALVDAIHYIWDNHRLKKK